MAGAVALVACLTAGALSCASGTAGDGNPPDAGPPSDGTTADTTLDVQGDSPGESSVDSTAPETASAVEAGAGDADETGVDAPIANDGGGMDSSSTLDTGVVLDTGAPEVEAGLGSGPFQIVNLGTGFVVDDSGGHTNPGNPVIQYQANGGTNQAWSPVSVAGGAYLLINQNSNLALDLSGTTVDQGTVSGGATQQWTFFPAGTAGYYVITSGGGGGVLTSPSSNQGDQLVVNPGVGSPSQEWRLVPAQ